MKGHTKRVLVMRSSNLCQALAVQYKKNWIGFQILDRLSVCLHKSSQEENNIACTITRGNAMQEVELLEGPHRPLQCFRFLTLNVKSINGPKMKSKRDTLIYLMHMDNWDVVFLQETHHAGDGRSPPSYAADFEECGYKGGCTFFHRFHIA